MSSHISGAGVMLLVVGIGIALLVHAAILHLAAHVVIEDPRFREALAAAAIVWAALLVVVFFHIPPAISLPVRAFAVFAGLKISYGASIPRTLALCLVSALIVLLAGFAGALIL